MIVPILGPYGPQRVKCTWLRSWNTEHWWWTILDNEDDFVFVWSSKHILSAFDIRDEEYRTVWTVYNPDFNFRQTTVPFRLLPERRVLRLSWLYGPTFRRHDATDIEPFSCENQSSDRSHTRCRILRAVRLAARRWKTVVDWNNGGLSHAPASWSTDTSAFYHRTTCTTYLTLLDVCRYVHELTN